MKNKLFFFDVSFFRANSYTLGLYRAMSYGWMLFYFSFENTLINKFPLFPEIENPIGIYTFFNQKLFYLDVVGVLYPVWLVSLFFSCIGLFTRTSMLVCLLLGYWIIGNTFATGMLSHQQFPHLIIFLIFACSDAGKDFSVDKKIFLQKSNSGNDNFFIPVFLLRSVLVLIFFSAAIAKIKDGGLLWFIEVGATDYFSRAHLLFMNFSARQFYPDLNVFLVKQTLFTKISCVGVFLIEFLSPLVFFKKFRWPILIMLAFFQVLAALTMFVDFESFIVLYIFWIPAALVERFLCISKN